MNIGIIGSGKIGGTLGQHWARAGHDVCFSSRHPETLSEMAAAIGARVGTVEEAARFGTVVLLAIPFGKIPQVASQVGALAGKVVIDATNPYPARDGEVAREAIAGDGTSAGFTAAQFPEARVVKAFNSVYFKVLEEQAFREGDDRIAVQLAGDDAAANATVVQLVQDIGLAPQNLGSLEQGRHFEPGAPLYNQNLPIREAEAAYRALQQG